MLWTPLTKTLDTSPIAPQLTDYAAARGDFSWASVRAALGNLPDEGFNIAVAAVDRWVAAGQGAIPALRWLGKTGERREFSYAELAQRSNQFANLLEQLGVHAGDRVATLVGRIPELYITALGALKAGAVFCPLFAAFGPEPIRVRLAHSRARVLVTTTELYRRKVALLRAALPDLQWVLLTDASMADLSGGEGGNAKTYSFYALLDTESVSRSLPQTRPEDWALLHFTSGTTGAPKGAIHVHEAVLVHYLTGRWVLDLRPGDIYWCTADPGWVTGVSYGIIAPLVNGVTLIVDEAEFEVRRWYQILHRERVNVWYTAPTAIRLLMKAGKEPVRGFDFSALRFIASVGEPLNPEGIFWAQEVLGQPVHDTWWQTETGAIMIANYRSQDIRPGSMGRPLPGIEAAIVQRREGSVKFLAPGQQGELALRIGWPSMFRGYLNDEARYRQCFVGKWYLSGDLVTCDADGYFWFVGRNDDVIKTAGHLVGPFEVESVLLEHPAVAEAAMIGKPDEIAGHLIKVFVVVKPGYEPSDALRREVLSFVRTRLGPVVAPRELEFLPDLPKTRSGKILRRLLRARRPGDPLRDLALEEEESEGASDAQDKG